MNTNTLILISISVICLLAFILRKNLKKIWFKLPGFEGGVQTHEITSINSGGHGGNAKVTGQNSVAIGGKGGAGGPGGRGGDGGSSEGTGDNTFATGGEGGETGQADRGGKGGRGPLRVQLEDYPEKGKEILEIFNMAGITEEMAKEYGKGGDGGGPNSKIGKS